MQDGNNRRKNDKMLWHKGAVCALVFFFALAGCLMLGLSGGESEGEYRELSAVPDGGCQALLLEEADGVSCFVFSGVETAAALAVSGEGEVLHRAEFSRPLYGAFLRGSSLFVLSQDGSRTRVTELRLPDFTVGLDYRAEVPLPEIAMADCGPSGELYLVTVREPGTVRRCLPDGTSTSRPCGERVEFLGLTRQGTLYLCAGDSLFVSDTPEHQSFQKLDCDVPPAVLLDEKLYLNADGDVCRAEGSRAEPVFHCPVPPSEFLFHCLGRENCLFWSDGPNSLRCSRLSGTALGGVTLRGSLKAVGSLGAVVELEQKLCYVPYASFANFPAEEQPTPPPAESPGPETPEPTSVPGVSLRNGFLFVPEGMRVNELSAWFRPEELEVRDGQGDWIASGTLATGMQANGYPIVVPGDCNGSGTVTRADVKAAQVLAAGKGEPGDAFYAAADLDGDGLVTAADLVSFSTLLK